MEIKICSICNKLIFNKEELRELEIGNKDAIFYHFDIHKDCILWDSILLTMNFLINKEIKDFYKIEKQDGK